MAKFFSIAKFTLINLALVGCSSPYSALGMPEIQGIEVNMVNTEEAEITIAQDFPTNCEYRRNALLLKSAYIALTYGFDHFEFIPDAELSRLRYEPIRLISDKPTRVYLCRGTCPLMYSADAISHLLVSKFSHPTWQTSPISQQKEVCYLKSVS